MTGALDIIDTAVKVGLGALIGGFSTYYISRLNHDKEMEKDRLRRKREVLEKITEKLDCFAHQVRNYWALLADWHTLSESEADRSDLEQKIKQGEDALYNAFHDLTSAESSLLLLGEKQASTALTNYGRYAQKLYKELHKDSDGIDEDILNEHRNEMKNKREKLLELMSVSYRSNQ